jgi:hypothetical protein
VTEFNESDGSEAPSGVSRRTVTKAMAWAVPVIAVSAAVPAYAASQINFNLNGLGCKLPGNSNSIFKGYAFALTIQNSSTVTITVEILSITLNGDDLGDTGLVDLVATPATFDDNPFTLSPGESFPDAALVTENAANSANGTLTITYTINDGTPIVVSATVNAAPPINGASCTAFTPAEKVKLSLLSGLPPVWAPNTAYLEGDTVRLSTGEVLVAEIPGTSGALQPTAPAEGGTVVDGSVTWRRPIVVP